MTLPRHDFTQPPPLAPQLRVNLAQWLTRSNALLVELLAGAAVSIELQFDCSSTMMPTQLTTEWTDKSLALQLKFGQHDAQSLVALPNPLVQELIGCILGDPPHKIPVERSLTAAELSVAEVIAEMIMRSLKESWQGDVPLNLALGETESNLRRTKRFRPKESLIVCRSIAKTKLGQSHWSWLMSADFVAHLFGLPVRNQQSVDPQSSRRQLEQLVRDMRAGMEVRLGAVQLTGPQLASLRVGDVVVLDQRVGDPLQASVQGEPKFLGWAGRTGNRQAFEIATEIQQRRTTETPEAA
jgi:flagellar motor switch protein FliM